MLPYWLSRYSTNQVLLQWVCLRELASDLLAHTITNRAERDRRNERPPTRVRCARRCWLAPIVLNAQTCVVAMGAAAANHNKGLLKPTIALLNPRAIVTNGQNMANLTFPSAAAF